MQAKEKNLASILTGIHTHGHPYSRASILTGIHTHGHPYSRASVLTAVQDKTELEGLK